MIRVAKSDDGVAGDMGPVDDSAKEELAPGTGSDLIKKEVSFATGRAVTRNVRWQYDRPVSFVFPFPQSSFVVGWYMAVGKIQRGKGQ